MDSLTTMLGELNNTFHTRMTAYEEELDRAHSSPVTISSLAAEFAMFRKFITQSLNSLQQQVELLARSVDHIEMRGRRKILLLHGVEEEQKEDTAKLIAKVICSKLQLSEFTVDDISRCHRMGRAVANKTRPILFKLRSPTVRDKVWFSKAKLKASGVTMSEFLTKPRHDVFLAARQRCGVSKSWTKAGCVYVLGPSGTRHRVESLAELDKIAPSSSEPQPGEAKSIAPDAVPTAATAKTARLKRVAALKK
ncbi:hypothetical protein PYW07_010227 [Mythimna separata]|uniref:Uncharacterized protein n=1 Tax=Mythimna separata TaxID=271217 RepID=A0AAD8DRE0_MYTSE|nr:hypothetical protein PYW07_013329 [Mythimna separata]KAJ8715745.1 hypothetical protein PYW07_010227 [Mythimna separata]